MRHNPKCLRCGGSMQQGYMLDRGNSNRATVATWIEGEPEPSFWSGFALGKRANVPCVTFRCTSCGWLDSYALSSDMV